MLQEDFFILSNFLIKSYLINLLNYKLLLFYYHFISWLLLIFLSLFNYNLKNTLIIYHIYLSLQFLVLKPFKRNFSCISFVKFIIKYFLSKFTCMFFMLYWYLFYNCFYSSNQKYGKLQLAWFIFSVLHG